MTSTTTADYSRVRDRRRRSHVGGPEVPGGPVLMEVTNAVVSACKAHTGKEPTRASAYLSSNALHVVLRD